MSSSGIGPNQEDPLGKYYRVEEIERIRLDERRGGREPPGPPDEPKPGFAASLFLLLQTAWNFLSGSIQKGLRGASAASARDTLLLLKAALETMMQEDRSQDSQFLKQISGLWLQLLEESLSLNSKPLKRFIKDVENHPDDEEHTFGYYLEEFAGQTWLPFPYMELIHNLHHHHELDPSSSLLTRWTRMIEEILNSG